MEPGFEVGPLEIWHSMGIIGKLVFVWLVLMSIHSFAVMIDRFLSFRHARHDTAVFVARARDALRVGDLAAAAEVARTLPRSHVARVYAAAIDGVEEFARGVPERFDDVLDRAVERESTIVSQELKRGLSILASIGATAPFVGLFGTVVGIMNSFFGMAMAGQGGIAAVAGGVAEALVNTAVGIFVALPAVWAFNLFLGRVETFHAEMRNAGSELKDHLIEREAA